MILRTFSKVFRNNNFIQLSENQRFKLCPTCKSEENVRISGKKGNKKQFYCSSCDTFFFPFTVNNQRKKIWHDKIKFKTLKYIHHWLGMENKDNIKTLRKEKIDEFNRELRKRRFKKFLTS